MFFAVIFFVSFGGIIGLFILKARESQRGKAYLYPLREKSDEALERFILFCIRRMRHIDSARLRRGAGWFLRFCGSAALRATALLMEWLTLLVQVVEGKRAQGKNSGGGTASHFLKQVAQYKNGNRNSASAQKARSRPMPS